MTKRLPLILAAVGILLRIIPVWAMPLWYDECFTVLLSHLPMDRMLAATAGDVHPPLWYLICWLVAYIPFLPAWAAIRIPSLLAGIAAIYVWWLVLKALPLNPRVRIVAFGLFCLLPQQIYYSQEGRMYALLTLLVLAAWLCILRRRWVWLGVVTVLMLWLQNYGLFYAVALWVVALLHERRNWSYKERIWKPLTISMAAAGLTFIPWLVVLQRQMSTISGGYWIRPVTLPSVLSDLSNTYFAFGLPNANMVNMTVFFGVLVWVLIWSLRNKVLNLPAVVLAFLPITLAALVSLVWRPIMLYRALIPSGAFIVLLLATPVERLGRKPLLLMAVFLIPALAVNLLATSVRSHWAGESVKKNATIFAMIDRQWQEGDLLYYADDGTWVSGAVVWKNVDNALHIEKCASVRGSLSDPTRLAIGMRSGDLPAKVAGRIWVITAETPFNPPCETDYLREHGLLETEPLACSQDSGLVKSCVYLVEP
jgi:uncharacterized membrane protein